MIHFPPLIGYLGYPGFNYIAGKMLKEATILEKSGFDAIIIENNYDVPHTEKIPSVSAAMFGALAKLLEQNTKLPFGLDVLWNDYETSLSICASTRAAFFRVPAFVDTVKTSYGVMPARAREIIALRKKLKLNHVCIFADIQVKHSVMVDKNKTLTQSAKEAVKAGADAIIITGKWTGNAPKTSDLKETRKAVGRFPILIGSGVSIDNLPILTKYADGIIVGTTLKEGGIVNKDKEVNLKPFKAHISKLKSKKFAKAFRRLTIYRQS